MNKTTGPTLLRRIISLYTDGFRDMTIGKSLWAIILIKLFIMFVILKIFFFPDMLGKYDNDNERADAVRSSLIKKTKTITNSTLIL